MVDDLLLDGRLRGRGIFDSREVTRIWHEHRAGTQDHRHRLWSLLMLELWFRQFADNTTSDVARRLQPSDVAVAPALQPSEAA